MRYLLKFNEAKFKPAGTVEAVYRHKLRSYSRLFSDIKEFIEEELSYLKDEGFDIRFVSVNKNLHPGYYNSIEIKKSNDSKFTWDEIKSDFIPFLEKLMIKYELGQEQVSKENDEYYKEKPEAKWIEKDIPVGYMKAIFISKTIIGKGMFLPIKNSNEVATYKVQDLIDDGTKSILHKNQVYPINNSKIDEINILI